MRTTLDIDEDVLETANELAARRGTTAGRIISELARSALASRNRLRQRNGVPLLPPRRESRLVTPEIVNPADEIQTGRNPDGAKSSSFSLQPGSTCYF